MRRYRVDLYGLAEVRTTVYVKAADERAAEDIARKEGKKRAGLWDLNEQATVESVRVDNAEEVED